jgi:carbamoyl-phosphate synthase large subunit
VDDLDVAGVFVKTPVFPFVRFPGVDTILGPEMKSTGEVMGGASTFGSAFAKAQLGAGVVLPTEGTAFISVNNHDKPSVVQIARALNVVGLMNAQFAIREDTIYVLEVNPRASRTVPYLSKATGVPLAKVAARVMIGRTLAQLGLTEDLEVSGYFVKTPVFPFVRFPGVDTILGPEMKSTGEVMGGASTFGIAFAKAQLAAGMQLPKEGTAFISVNNHDKPAVVQIARDLRDLGFRLVATRGTANYLRAHGLSAEIVFKVNEGRPHVGDEILNDRIQMVINTPLGRESFFDDRTVRRIAMMHGVPSITTLTGAAATVQAIKALRAEGLTVRALQEYHAEAATRKA